MMNLKKALLITAACMAAALPVYAADGDKPVELNGDTIEYASSSGVITATGNVRVIQDGAIMTGAAAVYNTKSSVGEVTGGVVLDKEDLHMTADTVKSLSETHISAQGSVVLTKADSTVYGSQIDYHSDREMAILPNGGRVVNPDAEITADYMESFVKEDRTVGRGNVHIVSSTRNLDAVGDNCEYFGGRDKQGKVILTGNAVVVQDGNTMRGNKMTLLMDEQKNVQTKPAE